MFVTITNILIFLISIVIVIVIITTIIIIITVTIIIISILIVFTVIYLMVVKNVSEAVIRRCFEIYSLEMNAKPATRDKNCFILDVGRDLNPSLIPTELSYEIGGLHAPFFPMVYFKYFE